MFFLKNTNSFKSRKAQLTSCCLTQAVMVGKWVSILTTAAMRKSLNGIVEMMYVPRRTYFTTGPFIITYEQKTCINQKGKT